MKYDRILDYTVLKILRLRYIEHLSLRGISRQLGIHRNTAKKICESYLPQKNAIVSLLEKDSTEDFSKIYKPRLVHQIKRKVKEEHIALIKKVCNLKGVNISKEYRDFEKSDLYRLYPISCSTFVRLAKKYEHKDADSNP